MNEWSRAAAWLYTTLTTPPITGIELQVFEDQEPEGTPGDWITFESEIPSNDVMVIGDQRVWTEFVVTVLAWTKGRSNLADVADEIDARLHRGSGTTVDGRLLECYRQSATNAKDVDEGVEYRGLGGIYNLIVQPLNN